MMAVFQVLLFLLKCVGILLLVLLGLVLLAVVTVLLAPIRYRGKLDKKEAPEEIFRADGLISWLNPLLRIRIRYTEQKLHYAVRILGIRLIDSDKPKKEKTKKRKKTKRKHRTPSGSVTENTDARELPVQIGLTERDAADTEPEQRVQEVPLTAEIPTAEDVPHDRDASEDRKKTSLFSKIKKFYENIKGFPETIKQKVTRVSRTVKLLWDKKEKTIAFFEDELHKTAIGTAWDTIKQVMRHVLPGKIKGYVEFGTGDPESTGKALGVLGILYARYGKGITVVPDFYEKRIVAKLEFKGRIRCVTLLRKGIRLIRDKQVKRFRKNFKKLLAVLKQKAE